MQSKYRICMFQVNNQLWLVFLKVSWKSKILSLTQYFKCDENGKIDLLSLATCATGACDDSNEGNPCASAIPSCPSDPVPIQPIPSCLKPSPPVAQNSTTATPGKKCDVNQICAQKGPGRFPRGNGKEKVAKIIKIINFFIKRLQAVHLLLQKRQDDERISRHVPKSNFVWSSNRWLQNKVHLPCRLCHYRHTCSSESFCGSRSIVWLAFGVRFAEIFGGCKTVGMSGWFYKPWVCRRIKNRRTYLQTSKEMLIE